MKRSLKIHIGFKAIILAFVLMLFSNIGANAYCWFNTQYGWNGNYMCLNWVEFNGQIIQKWDVSRDEYGNVYYENWITNFYGQKDVDWNNPIMYAEKDKYYNMHVVAGAWGLYEEWGSPYGDNANYYGNYPMDIKVYVDFNHDGEFDEWSELAGQYDNPGYYYEEYFSIYIPKDAQSGQTTMRIVCDYAYNNGNWGPFDACNSYYGEAKDFIIDIKAGFDIGITQITAPSNPLQTGTQEVKAILHNYADYGSEPVTYCEINWTIDGVYQSPIYWYGYLEGGSEEEVSLGYYDFQSKGAITKYSISAFSSYPNYNDDGNQKNDASPEFLATIPLPPGIYSVGGAKPDFSTVSEATDYLNSAGTVGDGDYVFEIRPGTYKGPFTMDNFSHDKANFVFERDPSTTDDVILTAASSWNNYVWYLNNIPNVTFRNLIFNVTDPYNYGARIMMIRGNADNYTFEYNTFNGMNIFTNPSNDFTIIDCQASQMNNQRYYKNTFNNGIKSLVLLNPELNSNGLTITDNVFNKFTNRAIHVEGIAGGVISNNTLKATTTTTNYGIFVQNGTVITNNNISGMSGSNNGAAISAIHNSVSSPATISNNTISGCNKVGGIMALGIDGGEINNNAIELSNSNLNSMISGIQLVYASTPVNKVEMNENTLSVENGYGIYSVNYPVDVLRNKIQTSNTGSATNYDCLYLVGSNGMVLLNELVSSNSVMELINSNFTLAYNSTVALGSNETVKIISGYNQIFRNQLVNKGSGSSITMTSANDALLDGNNYFTTSGNLGTIAGANYTSEAQMMPFDKNARFNDPMFKTNYNLKVTEFHDELNFNTPLENINWPNNNPTLFEGTTLDNMSKNGNFYVGAYIIFPTLDIIGFSDELIDCSGNPDRNISVSAATSTDQTPKYQWFKDGLPLQGQTSHILSFEPFDYSVSATYTCQVYCPGFGTKTTGTIPVYALTIPSIVEQPKEVINAVVGKDYSFNVRVHYRGINPPFYKDDFQWFKYDAAKKDSIPLVDDSRFAGTKSSDFTIRSLKDADICKPGDFYYVKVISQCGVVYSDPFVIAKTPELVFRDHPSNVNPCPNSDVIFEANAIAPEGFNLTYKWQKDGVDLTNDAKYNGVNTNKLQVFNVQVADQGNYICIASIPQVPTSKNSNIGILKVRDIPTAVAEGPTEITTKHGNDVTLKVNLIKGSEPLHVTWTYNGTVIKEALWSQYDGEKLLTIDMLGVNENQSGEYKCLLENDCNKTEVVFNLNVTKWDETGIVEVISENGYSLYNCAPNPTNGITKIKYEMARTENAVITLIDQSGRTVNTLFNGVANKGMNVLEFNTNSLNISAGVYFYTITTSGFSASLPIVIVK